jgi:hypothetical protein
MSGPQPGAASLARRLSFSDAVVVGLGAMLGAGVFSVFAPAARAAGVGLLIGLGVAACTRAGFEPYQHLEPDLRNVTDLAAARAPVHTDQIGGVVRPALALPASFSNAPAIFVLGDTLPVAHHVLHDGTDLAQLRALNGYQPVRVVRYGDLYLTVMRRVS